MVSNGCITSVGKLNELYGCTFQTTIDRFYIYIPVMSLNPTAVYDALVINKFCRCIIAKPSCGYRRET